MAVNFKEIFSFYVQQKNYIVFLKSLSSFHQFNQLVDFNASIKAIIMTV